MRIAKKIKNSSFYAIKLMKKIDIIKSKQADHIMNEFKILSMIEHPFVIEFDGFAQNSQFLYLSMELVNGGELFTYLRGTGRFGIDQSR